jgi:hypothetical protein
MKDNGQFVSHLSLPVIEVSADQNLDISQWHTQSTKVSLPKAVCHVILANVSELARKVMRSLSIRDQAWLSFLQPVDTQLKTLQHGRPG